MWYNSANLTKKLGLVGLAGVLGLSLQSCEHFPYNSPGGGSDPRDPDPKNGGGRNQVSCQGQTVNFRTLKQGSQCNIGKAHNQVVKTQRAYDALWQRMGLNARKPRVDFNKQFVIAAFQGQKPSSGFKIQLKGLCQNGQSLTATLTKTQPSSGCAVQSVLTRPYQLVTVSRKALRGNLNQLTVNFQSRIVKGCHGKGGNGNPNKPSFSTLDKGRMAADIQNQTNKVIRNQSQLKRVWRAIHGSRTNTPAVPKVDFQQKNVVGVFYGKKPSGGYEVAVQKAQKQGNQLTIKADMIRPEKGCPVTTVITGPYHLVTVPTQAQKVNFDLTRVAKSCR